MARGAGIYRAAGTFILKNTILATNAPGTNAYGTITDSGNNLSSDTTPHLAGTNSNNVDPKLIHTIRGAGYVIKAPRT